MAISMLKIRRPLGRLIFNMGIAIPGKTVFLIETAPSMIFIQGGEHKFHYSVNIMVVDDMTTAVARSSAAMILNWSLGHIQQWHLELKGSIDSWETVFFLLVASGAKILTGALILWFYQADHPMCFNRVLLLGKIRNNLAFIDASIR